MTIVIYGAAVATVEADDTVIYDGAVAVDGNRIAAVGSSREVLAKYPAAERIDAHGKAVMPGFANVHTHLHMTLARGIYEDLSPAHKPPFGSGLSPLPLPPVTPDEHRLFCKLGVLEAIRSGTTAILEDATGIDDYADDLAATGVRFRLTERAWDKARGSIGDQSGFEADRRIGERCLDRMAALHHKRHGTHDDRIRVGVSAWAPDMCSPELLRDVRALQQKLDTVATIHLNQIWGEVAAVKSVRGRLPTEYPDEIGCLNDRLIAAHCRYMEPHEEARLGKAGVSVSFNSAIAARRGLSPRIADLEAMGCRIAMGTDNMAEDMVEVVRKGLFMERVRRRDGRLPTPEQVHRWSTVNGYRAMGIPDGGALVAGNKGRPDRDRPAARPSGAGHAGRFRLCASGTRWGRLIRDGRRPLDHARAPGADYGRGCNRRRGTARRIECRLFENRPDLEIPKGLAELNAAGWHTRGVATA